MPSHNSNTVETFWSRVNKTKTCWLWIGAVQVSCLTGRGGYGIFWFENKKLHAHRFAYELINGPIPKGKDALHKCDVPLCVRPDPYHVFLGSHLQNMADARIKGRMSHKLSGNEVKEIRRLAEEGKESQEKIGERFGIRGSTVSRIKHRIRRKYD